MVGTAPHAGDVSSEEVALLAERLPSFAVDSVPGVGHYVHEERLEAVLAAVGRVAHDLASAHDHPSGSEPSHADRAGR
jgi:pimeloyl-ACP methyl ester carboxylesterase